MPIRLEGVFGAVNIWEYGEHLFGLLRLRYFLYKYAYGISIKTLSSVPRSHSAIYLFSTLPTLYVAAGAASIFYFFFLFILRPDGALAMKNKQF